MATKVFTLLKRFLVKPYGLSFPPRIVVRGKLQRESSKNTGFRVKHGMTKVALLINSAIVLSFFSICCFCLPGYCSAYNAEQITISSDRWPDSSSLERFGNDSVRIAGARTDEEKAIAIWRAIQHLTYATNVIPKEPALGINYVLDPLKYLNVYGGHWCDGLSRIMEMTWRSLGYRAQKLYTFGHTMADCHWRDNDGVERWHVFDLSKHWYVYNRTGTHIATKDELSLDHSLVYFPSRTPIPSNVSLIQPSYVHAGHLKIEPHNTGISLRTGETMERYWGNEGKPYYNIFGKENKKDSIHGPYPVTYGNGRVVYEPDLSGKFYKEGLYQIPINVNCTEEDGLKPALHPSNPKEKSTAIFKISLPYIISDAWLNARLLRENLDDEIRFSISVDGGNTWRTFWEAKNEIGTFDLNHISFCEPFDPNKEDLPKVITPFGRYDYLIKIEMKAAEKVTGCGLESISFVTVFQHNLFSLPMLWPGRNNITVQGTLKQDSILRVTYVWDDSKGKAQTHIMDIYKTPFQYEIITKGKKWEDVICHSIKIEILLHNGKKEEANPVLTRGSDASPDITLANIFHHEKLIGSSRPGPLRDASFYIKKIENELNDLGNPDINDSVLKNRSHEIGQAVLVLGSLKDPRAKEVLELVITKDRTHPFQNKIWACQALFQSVGQLAAPMMLQILERDQTIIWYDPQKKWSNDAMWLHTAAIAAAILAHIESFEGKERSADIIAAILTGKKTRTDIKKIWRGEEIEWGLIKALGNLGNKKHIPVLKAFLKEDSDARSMAIQALGDIGDASVTRDILTILKDFQYSPNGLDAIKALGKVGTKEIGPVLYPFLSHWDEDFRGAAAEALGRIGDDKAVPKIKEMIEKERFLWVINSAHESLKKLERNY